jgi:hypothetical protein
MHPLETLWQDQQTKIQLCLTNFHCIHKVLNKNVIALKKLNQVMHKFQEKEIQEKDNITSKSTKCSKFVVA